MKSNQKITIGLLAHQDLKLFQKFINDHMSSEHIFAIESSVFDWQHKGRDAYYCMTVKQEDEIIGAHGFMPMSHFDSELPDSQIFLALWKAAEDRGIGIGFLCYRNLLKAWKPEFMGSVGMNERTYDFHRWQGFELGMMDHHVVLSPHINTFEVASVPATFERPAIPCSLSISVERVLEGDLKRMETEALYDHQLPLKSDRYLINRYLKHPIYQYEVYAVSKENDLQALCVVRPIQLENSTVLRFVDYIGPNEAFPYLGKFVFDLLRCSKAEYLDFYSFGIPASLIQQAGFVSRHGADNLIVPNYFEPFVRKNVDLAYAYKSSLTGPPVRLFKADSDQDRPALLPQ